MKHEAFHDPRLSPQQNKAIEMLQNGFGRADIAEEMDISRQHLATLYSQARRKGVDVPRLPVGSPRVGKVSIERLVQLRADLEKRGFKRAGLYKTLSERTGLSINTIAVRLHRYDRGIQPKRIFGEQAA